MVEWLGGRGQGHDCLDYVVGGAQNSGKPNYVICTCSLNFDAKLRV